MPGYHLSGGGNQIPWYNWSNSNMANNTNTTSAAGNHNHTLNIPAFNSASTGNHNHNINIAQFNSGTTGNHSHTTDIAQFNSSTTGNHSHSTDIVQFNSGNNGGNETRPTNISLEFTTGIAFKLKSMRTWDTLLISEIGSFVIIFFDDI